MRSLPTWAFVFLLIAKKCLEHRHYYRASAAQGPEEGVQGQARGNASWTNSAFVPRNAWVSSSMVRATAVVSQPFSFSTSQASWHQIRLSRYYPPFRQLRADLVTLHLTYTMYAIPASSKATTSKITIRNSLGKMQPCLGAGNPRSSHWPCP